MPGRVPVPLVTLVILDGWGIAPPGPGNAVELARTPVFDDLWDRYPHTQLAASGAAVGLPDGQMGNSEVGHLTIGSGRILLQDLVRVHAAVRDGSLLDNAALVGAFRRARERGGAVHLLGLVSSGGVHSHIDHLRALLELSAREAMADRTWLHAFTDGRDVSPHAAADDLATLPAERIATVVGRYYAMDRDKRWERTDRAVHAIVDGVGEQAADAVEAVRASYAEGITDEFIEPIVLSGTPRLDPALDAAISFNFRPDRVRQLSHRLLERQVDLTTMTRYAKDIPTPVAFPEQDVADTLAETLSAHHRTSSTSPRPRSTPMSPISSTAAPKPSGTARRGSWFPRRATYRATTTSRRCRLPASPSRSRTHVGDGIAFCVVNFANPDMVGHTGVIPAVVQAVEAADTALERVVPATLALGGTCLVTADHGNAEKMLEDDGVSPHTAHTTNPVPLVLTLQGAILRDGGELSDLAPTVLGLLGIDVPAAMTGRDLVVDSSNENR